MQQQDQHAQTPTPTTTTTTTTKPTVQQSSAKKLVDMNLSEEEMFGSRRGTGNAFEFENKKLGDKWWNKSWIPVRKYKAGREFGKFFVYMLFPFAVILITGQPAIKEYIVMRSVCIFLITLISLSLYSHTIGIETQDCLQVIRTDQ